MDVDAENYYAKSDLNGSCVDWRKAASLGHQNSAQWVKDQCN